MGNQKAGKYSRTRLLQEFTDFILASVVKQRRKSNGRQLRVGLSVTTRWRVLKKDIAI